MPEQDITDFLRTTFRSVWTLELMLLLRTDDQRAWATDELIATLRASDLIVSRGLDELLSAGLIVLEENGAARYRPVSGELDEQAQEVEQLYAKSPILVRRLITLSGNSSLTAFSDAFRLRRS